VELKDKQTGGTHVMGVARLPQRTTIAAGNYNGALSRLQRITRDLVS